jgi:hypothetical protein
MINSKLIPAVIVVKPASTAKADIEISCRQVAQITTTCVGKNVYVEDIIVTFQGVKDIIKRVKSLTEHKDIQVLLVYNAKQIASSEKEYMEFITDMVDFYGLKVINYR